MFDIICDKWIWFVYIRERLRMFAIFENLEKKFDVYMATIDGNDITDFEVIKTFNKEEEGTVFVDGIKRGFDLYGNKIVGVPQLRK